MRAGGIGVAPVIGKPLGVILHMAGEDHRWLEPFDSHLDPLGDAVYIVVGKDFKGGDSAEANIVGADFSNGHSSPALSGQGYQPGRDARLVDAVRQCQDNTARGILDRVIDFAANLGALGIDLRIALDDPDLVPLLRVPESIRPILQLPRIADAGHIPDASGLGAPASELRRVDFKDLAEIVLARGAHLLGVVGAVGHRPPNPQRGIGVIAVLAVVVDGESRGLLGLFGHGCQVVSEGWDQQVLSSLREEAGARRKGVGER